MSTKLILKTVFLLVVLLLLVLMGVNNRMPVGFMLPPLLNKAVSQPAAIMYFAFFALGFLTGTVLTVGGKRGGTKSPSKPAK